MRQRACSHPQMLPSDTKKVTMAQAVEVGNAGVPLLRQDGYRMGKSPHPLEKPAQKGTSGAAQLGGKSLPHRLAGGFNSLWCLFLPDISTGSWDFVWGERCLVAVPLGGSPLASPRSRPQHSAVSCPTTMCSSAQRRGWAAASPH